MCQEDIHGKKKVTVTKYDYQSPEKQGVHKDSALATTIKGQKDMEKNGEPTPSQLLHGTFKPSVSTFQ